MSDRVPGKRPAPGVDRSTGNGAPHPRTGVRSEPIPAIAGSSLVERVVDYSIHGLVTVRLIDPAPVDEAVVERRFGHFRVAEGDGSVRGPDISIRYVPELATPDLRWVELGRSGFNPDGFFLFDGAGRGPKARVPFEDVGRRPEVVCEHGYRIMPLLMSLIRLTVVGKGFVATHASAFALGDAGVLATGWNRGGKTSALLAFAGRGAEFVGDDTVFLDREGRRMLGIPAPIPLTGGRLRELPRLRKGVGARRRAFQRSVGWLGKLQGWIPDGRPARSTPARWLTKLHTRLEGRSRAAIDPGVIFERCTSCEAKPHVLLLMQSHRAPQIEVEPADAGEVAESMARSVEHEQAGLFSHYLAYRFAFPDRANLFIDRAPHLQRQLLRSAVSSLETYTVRHPIPVPLDALYKALRPYCDAREAFTVRRSQS